MKIVALILSFFIFHQSCSVCGPKLNSGTYGKEGKECIVANGDNGPVKSCCSKLHKKDGKEQKAYPGSGERNPEYHIASQPVLSQIGERIAHRKDERAAEVRQWVRTALASFNSMRFLDLNLDAIRLPSLPGQTILGDRGENLSSVLQAIYEDENRRQALIGWIQELTPMDVVDFAFPPDQTGRVLVSLIEENERKTSAYSASDGTLRFLAVLAALLGPEPAHLYFFEELENGLHLSLIHISAPTRPY